MARAGVEPTISNLVCQWLIHWAIEANFKSRLEQVNHINCTYTTHENKYLVHGKIGCLQCHGVAKVIMDFFPFHEPRSKLDILFDIHGVCRQFLKCQFFNASNLTRNKEINLWRSRIWKITWFNFWDWIMTRAGFEPTTTDLAHILVHNLAHYFCTNLSAIQSLKLLRLVKYLFFFFETRLQEIYSSVTKKLCFLKKKKKEKYHKD